MGDRGINSFSGIHPFREGYCKGPGVYDFTQVDEDMERICRAVSYTHLDVYKRQSMEWGIGTAFSTH